MQSRLEGAVESLFANVAGNTDDVLYIDGGYDPSTTHERVEMVLQAWEDQQRIVIIALNDQIAVSGLNVARELGRESDVAVIGYDGTEIAMQEFANPDSRFIVSPYFFPERYGEGLADLTLRVLNGESVPAHNYVEPYGLTRENVEEWLASRA